MLIVSDLLAPAFTLLENKDLLSDPPAVPRTCGKCSESLRERDVLFQEENEGGIQFRDQAAGRDW